jgi:CubicO group peptidase (beta-lactamase class C family)
MAKAFIGAGVLLALDEHGLLDVDVPVWRLPGMDAYAADDLKRRVKVRHLLQQTAGLSNVRPRAEWPTTPCNCPNHTDRECIDPDVDVGPTVPWIGAPGITNECVYTDGRCRPSRRVTLEQVSRYVMETYPICQEPGSGYFYSTANYVVAARIIEALTGKSVNIYLKEKIFTPAGMKDSFFVAQPTGERELDAWMEEGVTEEQRSRIAELTLLTPDGRLPPEVAPGPDGVWDVLRRRWRYVYPDAGMYSTVDDLLNFLRMLREGGTHRSRRVLPPEIVRLLIEDQGFGHTMGFGFRKRTSPYGQGAGTLEHMGNMMTYFWFDPHPDNALAGVFLSQRLTNVAVNNNMADGMKVIFRLFVPGIKAGAYGLPLPTTS